MYMFVYERGREQADRAMEGEEDRKLKLLLTCGLGAFLFLLGQCDPAPVISESLNLVSPAD